MYSETIATHSETILKQSDILIVEKWPVIVKSHRNAVEDDHLAVPMFAERRQIDFHPSILYDINRTNRRQLFELHSLSYAISHTHDFAWIH